jgi:hypothetical protein
MPLAHLNTLLLAQRPEGTVQHLLECPACTARRIEEQQAGRLDAGALPSVRHIAWQEGAGAGPPTLTSSPILKVMQVFSVSTHWSS